MATGTATGMASEYAHLELGKDVATGIAGYYTPQKEVRLPFGGREILYVVGKAVLEASCCGTGNWVYATVPGYVLGWHSAKKGDLPLSEIQPVTDANEREAIARIIENAESVEVVTFW
jgi:hypothetical protein